MARKEFPIVPSTLEMIDEAFFEYIDEKLNISATTSSGWKKVPLIWASAERAYQVKNNKEIRDDSGTLVLPLISIERNSVMKTANKGIFHGNIPRNDRGGSITFTRRINQEKSSNFAKADSYKKYDQTDFPRKNNKIVYEWISMPMPVYVDVAYNLVLRADYQQQMNEMITPFITRPGSINYFAMRNHGHFYEGFIQGEISLSNNIASIGQEERKYETAITIKVLGYLIGEDKNQETPKMVIEENAVEVKLPRERIIFGDLQEHLDKQEDIPERMQNITDS